MNAATGTAERAGWTHFPHGADTGIRGFGPSQATAFEQAAVALTGLVTDPASVRTETAVEIHCEAEDRELLLVDWLNSLIYEMAVRHMLFGRFLISIRDGCLDAEAWGEAVSPGRHQPVVEPKGATYTELKVAESDNGWIAQCVIDV